SSQNALSVGERTPAHRQESREKQLKLESGALRAPTGALRLATVKKGQDRSADTEDLSNAVKIFWNKRTREKAGRPSPLHPRKPPRLGKIRFNWIPTRDLVRPWPFAIFMWAAIVVAAFAVLAVYAHKNAFAPDAIPAPHTRMNLAMTPAIATRVNGNS